MTTNTNPLVELARLGQSPWLDTIGRGLLDSGQFQDLVVSDGVRGVTSNPAIFEKAIAGTSDYDGAIAELAKQGKDSLQICEALMIKDLRQAADLLRPLYDGTAGADGFVSLEVSPHIADDTEQSVSEARRLWKAMDRPNLMIKIPATGAGVPAIRRLLGEGINVNVTLLFGLSRYREVAEAFLAGLEERVQAGQPVAGVASVASFFLSRIDSLLDPGLEKQAAEGGMHSELARMSVGEIAVACGRAAYGIYEGLFGGDRFARLSAKGVRSQRLLWASTGTKNPAYSDVKYVEPLIYAHTVNTLTLETIAAYRDHGMPKLQSADTIGDASALLERLPELGIDLDGVAQHLEEDGVEKFKRAQDQLIESIEQKRLAAVRG